MHKILTSLFIGALVAVSGCTSTAHFTLDTNFDSSPVKTRTKMTEALQCLGEVLKNNLGNPGAYVFMVRDIIDGTVNNYSDGPLADAGRIQLTGILTAHTEPGYGLVADRFPVILQQTNSEEVGLNRFGVPATENLNAFVSMLTTFANANRQAKGMPQVNAVMPLVIDGAFTRYDSSHIRSKGYGQNAGYRGDVNDQKSASIDLGNSGSERSVTLVLNIIDPKTNVVVGTEGFDLKFYSNSKTARFRVAIDEYYYGFSNTDVTVETVHAAQQTLLEAGAIWILDNAFGNLVDFSPCFDTDEKLALGRDARYQQAQLLPVAVAAAQQQVQPPAASPPPSVATTTPLVAPALSEATTPAAGQTATASSVPGASQYRVKKLSQMPESLSKIASYDSVYGDAGQWPRLYIANSDKFKDPANPDLIYPGQLIKIPVISVPKKRTNGHRRWRVVVGVFAQSRNVVNVSRQLSRAGYEANYNIVSSRTGNATQVWLGPYTEIDIAKKISVDLQGIIGEKGYVGRYAL